MKMKEITTEKVIELLRAAKKLKINGTTRTNLEVYSTYITTKIKIDGGLTERLDIAGHKYFYDGENKIKTEIERFPIYITLN